MKDFNDELEGLRSKLNELSDRLDNLGSSATSDSNARIRELMQSARRQLDDLGSTLRSQGERLQAKARETGKVADEYVHEHPWQSVVTTAAAGIMLGLLLGRGSKK